MVLVLKHRGIVQNMAEQTLTLKEAKDFQYATDYFILAVSGHDNEAVAKNLSWGGMQLVTNGQVIAKRCDNSVWCTTGQVSLYK